MGNNLTSDVGTAKVAKDLESKLKLLIGDYVGDLKGGCIGVIEGDTRSLDYGSCAWRCEQRPRPCPDSQAQDLDTCASLHSNFRSLPL